MFLGIDIGTSGVKAVLVDEHQKVVEQALAPLTVSRPQPLWSEQDPHDWWAATQFAVLGLSEPNRRQVQAIGLSGQMHGATLLDDAGAVLRPAILWNDGRSGASCEAMMAHNPRLPTIAGNLAMPGFTAPKLHWLRDNEPDIFARTAKVLLPKDYVRYRMCGNFASDMSDSAGTLWLDVAKRDWSDELLALTGLERSHMPDLYEGPHVTGHLSHMVASDWGMDKVGVAAGGGDNAAGAVGSGVIADGDGFISLGTSGVVFIADDRFRPKAELGLHAFCHALPERWHRMSVILSAASAIDFVAGRAGFSDVSAMFDHVEDRQSPSRGEIFLPYLSGERTPHNNPMAKGAFFGLTHETSAVDLGQAALEGVAFALADGIDALRAAGTHVSRLSVIGGGSRSTWWGRVIAAAANVTLDYRESSTVGPAFGAARLARLSVSEEAPEAVCHPPDIVHTTAPDTDLRNLYRERRTQFSQLYQATKDLTA